MSTCCILGFVYTVHHQLSIKDFMNEAVQCFRPSHSCGLCEHLLSHLEVESTNVQTGFVSCMRKAVIVMDKSTAQ